MLLRRKLASSASEYTPLLHLDSNAIQNHLISTNLSLEDVELVVGSATLLKNVNLLMKSGELTAVIGILSFFYLFLYLVLTRYRSLWSWKIYYHEGNILKYTKYDAHESISHS